ncbi:integral membrane protein [Paramyrothecium foliicola]|nr:integral membrane protein [Paramyrothecium foliicola]
MAQGSAIVGTPPNTDRDLRIVRGLYWRFGFTDVDPRLGYVLAAREPDVPTTSSRQPGVIGGMVVVVLAIVVPTVARLIVRGRNKNLRFGLDDWAIIVAAIVAAQYPILQLVAAVKGKGGRHVWEATYENHQELSYYLGVSRIFYYIATGLIKLSIALFVRRIAERASRLWRTTIDIFMTTVVLYILAAMVWFFRLCQPYRASYDMEFGGSLDRPVRCGDGMLRDKVLAIIHVVQGGLLLLAPIIILWKIQMNLGKKVRLFIIWIAGALTVLGGLLQLFTTVVVTNDVFYQYPGILVWTSVDLCMGILTASLPILDGAIMGSFSAVKTILSSSANRGHVLSSNTREERQGNSKTASRVMRSEAAREDSDSTKGIMSKENETELTIMRTDEIRVDYESVKDSQERRGNDLKI